MRKLWRKAGGDDVQGLGILDLRHRRYALDWGGYSVIYEDGLQWSGQPGRPRSRSGPEPRPIPLWLIDILQGTIDGSEIEPKPHDEDVDGGFARHLRIVVDFDRAAADMPSLYVPQRSPEFSEDPFTADVWVEGGYLRQIVFAAESQRHSLELFDFGITLDDFDWTRLPELRDSS